MAVYRNRAAVAARLSEQELQAWLSGGLTRDDGRLALFDQFGEPVDKNLIKSAIADGLVTPWFASPMSPQWLVCRLTPKGRDYVSRLAKTRQSQQ